MDFTFGICACKENEKIHSIITESIEVLEIPNYEIIFIGSNSDSISNNKKYINFTLNDDKGWITKKKNILSNEAKYENIVLMHDYFIFHPLWYKNFLDFGNNFDVAMNSILNTDGQRLRDWCLNPYDVIPPKGFLANREFLLPYEENNLSNYMYISGSYLVAKKQFMIENPFDENLFWGESEDIFWSEKVRKITQFKINSKSIISSLKYKYTDFQIISEHNLKKLKSFLNS